MMPQNEITVCAPVKPDLEGNLRQVLERVNADVQNNILLPFARISDSLHFARLLILDKAEQPLAKPAYLFFMANVDGSPRIFLQEFIKQARDGLDVIFGHCEGYPSGQAVDDGSRFAYLESRLIKANAYYINTIGRTVRQIRDEDLLRRSIHSFIDTQRFPGSAGALEIRRSIQEYVKNTPALASVNSPRKPLPLWWRVKEKLRFYAIVSGLVVAGIVFFPAIAAWLLIIRQKEKQDAADSHRAELSRLNSLRNDEDHFVHNQFSATGYVKPGIIRMITVRVILAIAQVGLRHIFNNGNLAGVKALGLDGVYTIHFARWILIDNNQRMVFASNYDGSLESYMVDFVDKVAWGLNLVFSNGVGYPKSRWLVLDGARDEQRFKDFIGNHQIPTQVWYTPYGHLSAINIANNAAIRDGLFGSMKEAQAQEWLRRI
ncbi:MAG: hypothetical protein L0Z73_15320 [Gammaproteobacteria bacterium]|nr:hypothetical protein [Gammaproteobacteria bacterium]